MQSLQCQQGRLPLTKYVLSRHIRIFQCIIIMVVPSLQVRILCSCASHTTWVYKSWPCTCILHPVLIPALAFFCTIKDSRKKLQWCYNFHALYTYLWHFHSRKYACWLLEIMSRPVLEQARPWSTWFES